MPYFYDIVLGTLTKMVTLYKGNLALFSGILSGAVTTGIGYYLRLPFKEASLSDVILILMVEIVFMTFFIVFTTVDLVTGIQAALYENTRRVIRKPTTAVITSSKLWRTFWKCFGVIVLTIMLTALAVFTLLIKSPYGFWASIWFLVGFWIMACGFEFYSIGENLAKVENGRKPKIFGFVDKIFIVLQRRMLKSIDNSKEIYEEIQMAKRDEADEVDAPERH